MDKKYWECILDLHGFTKSIILREPLLEINIPIPSRLHVEDGWSRYGQTYLLKFKRGYCDVDKKLAFYDYNYGGIG